MTRWLAAAGALAFVAVAPAADAPERLVRQLGAPRYADREAAEAALAALGPAAIPALQAAVASADPETARRAAGLLARARRAADSAALLAVRPIRLNLRAAPLAVAVEELRTRTGVPVVLDRAGVADMLRPVTCVTGDVPPWEAIAAFCRAAGLREVVPTDIPAEPILPGEHRTYHRPPPPLTAADVPIRLVDGTETTPGVRGGAVRVVVLPASFGGAKVDGQRTLHLDVTPLPSLKWEGVTSVSLTRVIDDAGRAGGAGYDPPPAPVVVPTGGHTEFRVIEPAPPSRPNPRVVAVPVRPGSPTARRLAVLEGVVHGEVTASAAPLATVAAEAGRAASGPGGALVVLAAGGEARVRLTVPSPWPRLRRAQPTGPLWPDAATPVGAGFALRAFDRNGKELTPTTDITPVVTDDGIEKTVTWTRRYPAPPARFEATGSRVVRVEVPFRLTDVPLP